MEPYLFNIYLRASVLFISFRFFTFFFSLFFFFCFVSFLTILFSFFFAFRFFFLFLFVTFLTFRFFFFSFLFVFFRFSVYRYPFTEVFCVMYAGSVQKIFTEIKEWKTVFNFFVFCLLQKLCVVILTISLQVNFYRILWKRKVQWQNLCDKNKQFWFCYYENTRFLFLEKSVMIWWFSTESK